MSILSRFIKSHGDQLEADTIVFELEQPRASAQDEGILATHRRCEAWIPHDLHDELLRAAGAAGANRSEAIRAALLLAVPMLIANPQLIQSLLRGARPRIRER
ncbi:hypothetical protein dsx2_2618 [Desulfovibrio sp. X2]|uniref:hypothetical protein n=1 Tax=Desulfovibrio sp. X2 TaxID=941449 RepID=UPI000358AB69|nr:hypothetical protein [Desulfovibrio sp. X2]EPR42701.1 hypothetical protein dsx2_2618 [Desulfovibrio sp. X2]